DLRATLALQIGHTTRRFKHLAEGAIAVRRANPVIRRALFPFCTVWAAHAIEIEKCPSFDTVKTPWLACRLSSEATVSACLRRFGLGDSTPPSLRQSNGSAGKGERSGLRHVRGAGAVWRDFVVNKTNRERLFASTLLAGMASLGVPLAVGGAMLATATDAVAQDYTSGVLAGQVTDENGNG